ncbi:MAG TPA: hypothetical protein VE991_01270 [Acidimicrobiales bacterium]|nr:hypothetical protein [Acidimicrobiales bacterium]
MARSAPDPDWTDREAEGQPGLEDQPPGYTAETALEGDPLPGDRPVGSDSWGTTAREERVGESLEERVAQEQPDVVVGGDEEHIRMAEPESDDVEPEIEEHAAGLAPEESAMHVERGLR